VEQLLDLTLAIRMLLLQRQLVMLLLVAGM
jgi:hypothetical protein